MKIRLFLSKNKKGIDSLISGTGFLSGNGKGEVQDVLSDLR